MKRVPAISLLLLLTFLLSACSGISLLSKITPTPPPPPVSEDAVWRVEILKIQRYTEPAEFSCADCGVNGTPASLTLQKRYAYLDVTANILNKTNEAQGISVMNIGLLSSTGLYGCGGVTLQGSDFCLFSGLLRGEKKFIDKDIDTFDSKTALTFEPNSPSGEVVHFIFIVLKHDKLENFYFGDLSPVNTRKIKIESK